jgi:ornithine racemase
MATVRLTVNLDKITENTRKTLALCHPLGLEVVGVTKGVCGSPEVARAMIAGGIKALGDSRLDNIARMRKAGIRLPMILLRSPAPSEVEECISLADISLNVDPDVLSALSAEATRAGTRHSVILMVDLDTGREGFHPEALLEACRQVLSLKGLMLKGIGVYFAYQSKEDFQRTSLRQLVALVRKIEGECGIDLPVISGGSTNVFGNFVIEGSPLGGVNQLRIGTAILLGIASSIGPRRIKGFHQDTFVLSAELIEIKKRDRLFGILSLGQLDTAQEYLFPILPGVTVVSASSDHTVVDLTEMVPRPRVGDCLTFQLGYFSLMRLMASPYVSIEYHPN